MAKRPDGAKQDRWLELIRRWQQSQITVREFCRRHQVSEASFFSWRRVLRERGLLGEALNSTASADVPAFVRLTAFAAEPTPVEIILNQRRLLRVRPGFDADMLLQLVCLLEESAC